MNRNSKTVGVLMAGSFSLYDPPICMGIRDAAREMGVGVVFVPLTLRVSHAEQLYENLPIDAQILNAFAESATFDGVIILDEELRSFFPDSIANQILTGFTHLPTILIGDNRPNLHNMNADHYHGMLELMEHILTTCGYERIAFVKGIENTLSAQERYRAYLDALKKHKLEVDPTYIVEGNFRISGGLQAVETLLDERNLKPDVIVCANDDMALGAVKELQLRNIAVPEEIAVTGFDNSTAAIISEPALTTVDQPLFQMGRNALNLLVSTMKDPASAHSVSVPTRLVVRESTFQKDGSSSDTTEQFVTAASTVETLSLALPLSLSHDVREKLAHLFLLDCQNDKKRFLEFYGKLLGSIPGAHKHNWLEWQIAMTAWLQFAENLPADDGLKQGALLTLSRAQTILTEQVVHHHIGWERSTRSLEIVERELFPFMSMDNMMTVLRQTLQDYGVTHCFFGQFDARPNADEKLRLNFRYDADNNQQGQRLDKVMPLSELVQHAVAIAPDSCWMAQHITFEDEYLGYMLLATDAFEEVVYDVVTTQVANALKLRASIERLERQARELEEAVHNRTIDLQMIVSEKEDKLNMVIHDLRNPLSAINLNLRLLSLSTEANSQERSIELLERLTRNTNSMKQLLEHMYAENARAEEGLTLSIAPADLNDVVAEAVERCVVHAASKSITLDLVQAAEPAITDVDRLLLIQSIENLVSNAIKFSSPDKSVYLAVQNNDDAILITIRDEGQGLSADDLEKIFGRYQKLSATPTAGESSTGLGLYIVQKLIAAMGGEISAESPGKDLGATFTIALKRTS